ncbi:hypothetical protein DOM22_03075 [Bdellovibrio sp. ZAP7]|uniref:hypothetical protein n=1 Tax=Bdellovibrio sp. ZAP7 TaxID=2231053 RepID=UPI001157D86F|nr:hypothetical protein [Bdellovibrio sp. ZAP7]QDK44206.1 hypothetical protein DOM22_03075 [Bdellovibrio sp. ZAP7]
MDSRWLKIVFSVLTVMSIYAIDAGAAVSAATSCEPSKGSGLAMDQRDDYRLKCLKKKKNQLSVSQCLSLAKSMEYSNNSEDARMVCLYDLQKVSLKECAQIAKNMEYADSGDETKWHCIREFNKTISKKQCLALGKSMSYPANSDRAQQYCENELQ